jgi:cation diffusion facilitator CzcD-associated flavoprotein CzcO
VHFSEPWLDVMADADGVTVVTARDRYRFAAVIFGTGFSVDLAERPELAPFHEKIAVWGNRVSPQESAMHPDAARFPYLGPGFEFTERVPGAVPGLSRLHCFNAGAIMSHAALGGDIPGLAYGANRLAHAIARALFIAAVPELEPALHAFDDRELEPTRLFVAR